MRWVLFEKAAQALPGAKMRRVKQDRRNRKGRPKEMRVVRRENDRVLGNVIRFDDGTALKVSDAKRRFEVCDESLSG